MQLELFPWQDITFQNRAAILGAIRNAYWHIRNSRGRYSQASNRRHYRRIADHKKCLQLAGITKREILDFLSCCRLGCQRKVIAKCLQCVEQVSEK